MPELAFAYACGKEIMSDALNVFGGKKPIWMREVDLGNGGPTDLVIKLENSKDIAIEFKLRDTADAYISDLEKLNKLDSSKYVKVFCALIDTFTSDLDNDGRIKKIESFECATISSVLEPKPSFGVKQDWYKKDVSCVIGIWTVE